MKLIVTDDYEALSRTGADIIETVIAARPDAALLLATGDSPMGIYRELAARRAKGLPDTAHLRIFQLDEYLDVPPDDERSLYGWMARSFVRPLDIPETNVVRLPWNINDVEAGCAAYDQALELAGGYDLSVLGLGPNGHLGFNEPPSDADAPTRVVELTEASIESNIRYWGRRDRVPRRAVTAGMIHLLAARQTMLVVSGAHKREILRRAMSGPVTPDVPASYLQRVANVTLLADRAAWPEPVTSDQ